MMKNIQTHIFSRSLTNGSETYLSLAILYIQKCNSNKAQEYLEKITHNNLTHLLTENYDLLFDVSYSVQNKTKTSTTFTELAVLLISVCSELLSTLFVALIMEKKIISLNKMLKVSIF